jgi:hypothetical protein
LIFAAGSIKCPPLISSDRRSRASLVDAFREFVFISRALSKSRSRSIRADPCKSVAHFAFPNARARIAIRVGTPLCTSSMITDCGPSATSAVNSKPADDRPGMHHNGVALGQLQPRRRHLVTRDVVLQRIF